MTRNRPSGPAPGTPEFYADAENRLRALAEDGNRRWEERVRPIEVEIADEVERVRLDHLAYRVMLRRRSRRLSRRTRRDLAS